MHCILGLGLWPLTVGLVFRIWALNFGFELRHSCFQARSCVFDLLMLSFWPSSFGLQHSSFGLGPSSLGFCFGNQLLSFGIQALGFGFLVGLGPSGLGHCVSTFDFRVSSLGLVGSCLGFGILASGLSI
ncbi:hypothetical protein AXF42_Ash020870 [Apostasia shenzhenica]|uniref:Uncharacterized protein n=1 Tax=Apostasia shenzhenica TaxID=1088818 RepID=A0A2H9ZRY0_9ASPA|nr:hypothetical protein AXF42_Ash020870 [Apostasia shenzhenica]